jgi:hypothetical protein
MSLFPREGINFRCFYEYLLNLALSSNPVPIKLK